MSYEYEAQREQELDFEQQPATLPRPEFAERDTPDPIVFDDAVGKTVIAFQKLGLDRESGVPSFAMHYAHKDRATGETQQYPLSDLMDEPFWFSWNTHGSFSLLSAFGDRMITVNERVLRSERPAIHLLAHEIGHTHQGEFETAIFKMLAAPEQTRTRRATDLIRQKPEFKDHIAELFHMAKDEPELADFARASLSEVPSGGDPLGAGHRPVPFLGIPFKHYQPEAFKVVDAIGEVTGWLKAFEFAKEGALHPGTDPDHAVEIALSGLRSYDAHYRTDLYTTTLLDTVQAEPSRYFDL